MAYAAGSAVRAISRLEIGESEYFREKLWIVHSAGHGRGGDSVEQTDVVMFFRNLQTFLLTFFGPFLLPFDLKF